MKELQELDARLVDLKRAKRKREQEILDLTAGKVCWINSKGQPVTVPVTIHANKELDSDEDKPASYFAVRFP